MYHGKVCCPRAISSDTAIRVTKSHDFFKDTLSKYSLFIFAPSVQEAQFLHHRCKRGPACNIYIYRESE
jgi:hypothetical protein